MANIMQLLPELEGQEMILVQNLIKDMDDTKAQLFANSYRPRRKDPQTLLLVALVGFVGVAGIQRFMIDEIGMGLLFLFTGGFCGIGTIVDMINAKKLAYSYNQAQAHEVALMLQNS